MVELIFSAMLLIVSVADTSTDPKFKPCCVSEKCKVVVPRMPIRDPADTISESYTDSLADEMIKSFSPKNDEKPANVLSAVPFASASKAIETWVASLPSSTDVSSRNAIEYSPVPRSIFKCPSKSMPTEDVVRCGPSTAFCSQSWTVWVNSSIVPDEKSNSPTRLTE